MCGRVGFYNDEDWRNVVRSVVGDISDRVGALTPSYNTAPSQPLATLLNTKTYTYTRFGLIPHWAKDGKFQPINARAETISQKPTFKSAFARRRCLIPVNGFYEWQRTAGGKIPYWFTPGDEHDFFALAGIYDEWHDPATGETVTGSAIITTEANGIMRPVHDRMPVIIPVREWNLWLDPAVEEPEALRPLLSPYGGAMRSVEVTTYVNSPAHNDAGCLVPAG